MSTVLLFSGCAETTVEKPEGFRQMELAKYAEGFAVSVNNEGVYRVELYDLENEQKPLNYTFYLSADSTLVSTVETPMITIPITSLACLSTTHIALLDKAGALNSLTGVAFGSYIKNEKVLQRIESQDIDDLSGAEDVDMEKLLDLSPQAFLVYPFGQADYSAYEDEGIPCLPFSEYLESNPLARAEWMLLTGLMCGTLDQAQRGFASIENSYLDLVDLSETAANKPTVFTGSYTQGVWFAPSGNSLISRFIEDASGSYIFSENKSPGNIELQFEELFDLAYEVDFWGKVVYEKGELTLAKIREQDERYSELKAFRETNIFYCNASEVDYFGAGIVEPEIILSDLLAIFHPSLLPDHQASYFKKIER